MKALSFFFITIENVLLLIINGFLFHLFCAFHFKEKADYIDVIAGFRKSVNNSGNTILFSKIFFFFVITLNEKVDHRSNHKDKA